MTKRDRTAAKLDCLAVLKGVTDRSVLLPAIREALDDAINLVAARGAQLAMRHDLQELSGPLVSAFSRFMQSAQRADPGCVAKTAIADAMVKFNGEFRDSYLCGLHHIQLEPVWGGSKDTAAKLRGLCALGLVALGHNDVLYQLADLMFDPDPEARLLACRALGGTGVDAAALLLRAKLAAANDNAEIYGECFASLLSLQPNRSIEYIARFLVHTDPQMGDAAALTIGGSRHERAFQLIRDAIDTNPRGGPTAALLLAMAMTRQPAAVERLLAELASGRHGADAAAALRILRSDSNTAARVEAVLADLNAPAVERRWRNG